MREDRVVAPSNIREGARKRKQSWGRECVVRMRAGCNGLMFRGQLREEEKSGREI